VSHYVKFTYQRARPDIAPFDAVAEGGIATFRKNLEDAFDVVMRERGQSSPCI